MSFVAPALVWGSLEPFRRQAEKRLRILEAAVSLGDLRQLPENRLKALKGEGKASTASGLMGTGASAGDQHPPHRSDHPGPDQRRARVHLRSEGARGRGFRRTYEGGASLRLRSFSMLSPHDSPAARRSRPMNSLPSAPSGRHRSSPAHIARPQQLSATLTAGAGRPITQIDVLKRLLRLGEGADKQCNRR
jgi:hypothetical protein